MIHDVAYTHQERCSLIHFMHSAQARKINYACWSHKRNLGESIVVLCVA